MGKPVPPFLLNLILVYPFRNAAVAFGSQVNSCRALGHQSQKEQNMPEKVLIFSRFPKALMLRIGERFELMDAGGKPPGEVFTADQLAGVAGDDLGWRHPAAGYHDGHDAGPEGDRLLRHRL